MTAPDEQYDGPLPNFLVCGAAKAGTSSLYHNLQKHPNVFMAEGKEPNFFNRHYDKGLHWYSSFYADHTDEAAIGEASVSTMVDAHVTAERIEKTVPEAKLIFVLRNPIERAYSEFWHNVRMERLRDRTPTPDLFDRVVRDQVDVSAFWPPGTTMGERLVEKGMYATQISHFEAHFSTEQMQFIPFSKLKNSTGDVVDSILDFIGVDSSYSDVALEKRNVGKYPVLPQLNKIVHAGWTPLRKALPDWLVQNTVGIRHVVHNMLYSDSSRPAMKEETRGYLQNVYQTEIQQLEKRLQWDLSHWQ